VSKIRVVDIIGLHKQADGETTSDRPPKWAGSCAEDRVEGKGNKRIRPEIADAQPATPAGPRTNPLCVK